MKRAHGWRVYPSLLLRVCWGRGTSCGSVGLQGSRRRRLAVHLPHGAILHQLHARDESATTRISAVPDSQQAGVADV